MAKIKHKDFCIFILTHWRPNKVITYKTLLKAGCTYPIYFIIDNEDKTADEYYKNFGKDKVIMFDKLAISKTFDTGDNFDNRKTIVFARNACFGIAKKLGYKYFLQLDDDYTNIWYTFNNEQNYDKQNVLNSNKIIDITLDFYKKTKITSLAYLQGGDMLGGQIGGYAKTIRTFRKCMNSFYCCIDRPFKFIGRINEDVNTYVSLQKLGHLFVSFNNVVINQLTTQNNKGGMTETYLESGTYIKSFYTVMFSPSCTKIELMHSHNERLHHKIKWDNAVPKIVSEGQRKTKPKIKKLAKSQ